MVEKEVVKVRQAGLSWKRKVFQEGRTRREAKSSFSDVPQKSVLCLDVEDST